MQVLQTLRRGQKPYVVDSTAGAAPAAGDQLDTPHWRRQQEPHSPGQAQMPQHPLATPHPAGPQNALHSLRSVHLHSSSWSWLPGSSGMTRTTATSVGHLHVLISVAQTARPSLS